MGKATRWIKGLLGMKDKENVHNININSSDRKDKKRWSFGKPLKHEFQKQAAPSDAAWLRPYMSETEKEQNKHATVVAAATAAAAAAVAVVRLTNLRGKVSFDGHDSENRAAIKIQTVFRSHLARKALRALKGLVKLQALVRGFLVRKRAVATLHSMQALVRAQAAIRSDRARRSFTKHQQRSEPSEGHRKSKCYDESSKIVEIDTYKPQSRSQRINNYTPYSGEDFSFNTNSNSNSSSQYQYNNNMQSLHQYQNPVHTSIPEFHHLQDFEWGFVDNDYKLSNTAQSSPRFSNSNRSKRPTNATKSVCRDSFFRPYYKQPELHGSTQSSKAKLRSHSAPKQRPDLGAKKRLSLNEIVASRYSLSGLKMQKSCYEVQEAIDL